MKSLLSKKSQDFVSQYLKNVDIYPLEMVKGEGKSKTNFIYINKVV